MAKGSGNNRASSSSNPKGLSAGSAATQHSKLLNAAGNKVADLVAEERWDEIGWQERDKIMEAADRGSSTLRENDRMYTDDEWEAITSYQGNGAEFMNDAIEGRKTRDESLNAEVKEHIKNLDKALKRRKLTKDIVVWRGSTTEESDSGRFKSTSLKVWQANEFRSGNHLHAYLIPKGTHYVYRNWGDEHEVILPRNFDLEKHRIR